MIRRKWRRAALVMVIASLALTGCGADAVRLDAALSTPATSRPVLPSSSPVRALPTFLPTGPTKQKTRPATEAFTPDPTDTYTPNPTDTEQPHPTDTVTPDPTNTVEQILTATPQATRTPAAAPVLPPQSIGIAMPSTSDPSTLDLAVGVGAHWARVGVIKWNKIEPVRTEPPTYHWEVVDEAMLSNASARGLQIISIVQFAPEWAHGVPGWTCGPIHEQALGAFAQFMSAVVTRYSVPPYNVHHWELGNEPDIDPDLVKRDSGFGCWGDDSDPYYGGETYAEMLKRVSPAIKAADPQAQVLIGGLLLDCDPTHPPEGKDCKPARFLEGILRGGGAGYFDIVSFHGYALYNGSLELDRQYPGWEYRGGVVLGKIDFLREVMAAYGVSKPLMHTEGALLCPEQAAEHCAPPTDGFFEAQADYAVWLYVRNWAADVEATIWYGLRGPGWRYGGLLNRDQQPKRVYNALRTLAERLAGAAFSRQVTEYPDLEGYEFTSAGKRIWVLWAPDGGEHFVSLPAGTLAVRDKYGFAVSVDGDTLSISRPVYIELVP